ncbi:WD40 repeat-like protein [Venustampulla echinocandica]|uniref:WD40 repeat-like protein n=1 Tax=Venustampulla echinocandica TaxID=2656787 RepID=A0A370TFJ1_9HELO|nr:WD40 repeat-like protein [Venustampulla echinocandica]RDL33660.1 WD40 repeat-like protein [Venustampulla echinocandica]
MPQITDHPSPSNNNAEQDGFALLQHGHRDMVEATAFNSYGDRFASSSVDGKIKVFNRHKDGSWNICDTWGAHTSEILEIQWLSPTIHPNLIASIGTDGKFKLWVEDPTIAPGKGRRFNSQSNKPVWELRAPSRAPFLSFSIKHNPETRHTYLALINRNALLTVYENDEPENMESWMELDQVNVCDRPARGEEVSFKVAFDPNLEPCYSAIRQGVQRDALGVIVASMNKASIWRTKEISHAVSLGSSSTKEFYFAAELKGHRGLVRDVAWAPGNIRGFDVVATACKDGFVRVFEVATPSKGNKEPRSKDFARMPEHVGAAQRTSENGLRNFPSGIGAGLASARPGTGRNLQSEMHSRDGEVIHVAKEASRLDTHRPVWRVEFDADGQLLGSAGDDGKLVLWRREPSGSWSKSSELAMTS